MTWVRRIAVLLAMVIAAITVSLTPSSAHAHAGRPHAGQTYAAAAAHAPARTYAGSGAVTRAVAPAVSRHDCADPCCGVGHAHGSCCCAAGLAPEEPITTGPALASARSLPCGHASPDGIVPEALPEPPRPLA